MMKASLGIKAIRFPLVLAARVSAPAVGGFFVFPIATQVDTEPLHNLLEARYILRSMRFSCDANELDYQAAMVEIPKVRVFQKALGRSPMFLEPIPFPTYCEVQLGQAIDSRMRPDKLLVSVEGKVEQTIALVGKVNLTALIVMTFDVETQNVR